MVIGDLATRSIGSAQVGYCEWYRERQSGGVVVSEVVSGAIDGTRYLIDGHRHDLW